MNNSDLSWAKALLREYWGYADFRGIQREIISSISAGNDTLGLMPTGGGKSITFQVPALAMEGTCIVVTPLIALMKDQVEHLHRRNITAAAIYSGLSREDILRHLDNAVFGAYKFLYVSPERLSTEIFKTKIQKMAVSFITVDEAHCISQWGYDFRPSYLQIAKIRELVPHAPILALTATATPRVVTDICDRLSHPEKTQQREFSVFRMSFGRPNLHYIVRKREDKMAELVHILRSVKGSAIVYTRSRQGTREVCEQLKSEGFTALYYHAGLTNVDKDVRQAAWQSDEVRIMVATNAFGMGIDKPDVRLVVHMDLPDSVEAYFQEAGRGGRDGKTAWAVLLYNRSDHGKMLRRIPETFPEKDYIRKVYDSLAYYFQLAVGDGFQVTYEFHIERFCVNFKLFPVQAISALNILSRAGYIDYRDEEESTSRVYFLTQRDELYRLHHLGTKFDLVIRSLLRHYGGLFSDYVYIEEAKLAHDCQMSENEVYETLKSLNHQRILHYIPRKRAAYITYLTRRVESQHLCITPEVYEERKQQYLERIQSILDYAENDDYCRSRFLLEYFGDHSGKDCDGCDVCYAQKKESTDTHLLEQKMLKILEDGHPHPPYDLRIEGHSFDLCIKILQRWMDEERILFEKGCYRLHR